MTTSNKKIIVRKHPFNLLSLRTDPKQFALSHTDDQLGKILEYLSDYYYNNGSIVDDQVFDQLQDSLKARNPTHPALSSVRAPISSVENDIKLDSITGPTITNPKHRIKIPLPYWMGSMDKNKPGESGLANWFGKYPGAKCMSDKMDGMSALLYYSYDSVKCVMVATLMKSGSSKEAEDVSCLIPYLKLPKVDLDTLIKMGLCGTNMNGGSNSIVLAIRAEMIISLANFKPYSKLFKNPRNMVAGIVNSKTIKTILIPCVDFIAYEIIEPIGLKVSDQFKTLEKLGFQVAPYTTKTNGVDESWLKEYFIARRKNNPYEIDGIIVADDQMVHPRNTTGNPKYAFAFKMMTNESEQVVETEVIGITWEPQKDGYLFPVVQVKPVFVSGITIQNCSGKNAKFMVDNCIGTGAIIKITRDGDVIPGIFSIVKPSPIGIPEMPDPVQMAYHWTPTGVDIILDDINNSPEVRLKRTVAFFRTMNVVGFSHGLIARCMEYGLDTVPKIINATVVDFLKVPGIQIKMANKIYDSIHTALLAPELGQLMHASNAFGRGFGDRKIKLLLTHMPHIMDWDTTKPGISAKLVSEICKIQGFDTKTAEQFTSRLGEFKTFLKTLPINIQKSVINPYIPIPSSAVASASSSSPLVPNLQRFSGKTIVFTGFRNKDWETLVEKEGGKITNSISSNTTMLVLKDKSFTSSKVTKAEELGVEILDMNEFKDRFGL